MMAHRQQQELDRRISGKYKIVGPIGDRTPSKVYTARCLGTGQLRVVKKVDRHQEGSPTAESLLLSRLEHENIVKLLEDFRVYGRVALVYELAQTDLNKLIRRKSPLYPRTIQSLAFQLCRGIGFCHEQGVVHRDLKPEHLLVAEDLASGHLRLRIAGFGLAQMKSRKGKEALPAPAWYRAPEILLGKKKQGTAMDMWSVGCVIGEMTRGSVLFKGDSDTDILVKVFEKLGMPSVESWPGLTGLPRWQDTTWPAVRQQNWESTTDMKAQLGQHGIDLLTHLLSCNPATRLSASRTLRHPYFGQPLANPHARVRVSVSSLGGSVARLRVRLGESVGSLLDRAKSKHGSQANVLVASNGERLARHLSLAEAAVFDGEALTSVVIQTKIYATKVSFAAVLGDGRVVTWGDAANGGDSLAVQAELQGDVRHMCSTWWAFAALLGNGHVVTWGDSAYGGQSSAVQELLQRDVVHLSSTSKAFAAVRADGRVVTWGHADCGGDSSAVQDLLPNNIDMICSVYSTLGAFAVLLGDGNVITWGSPGYGGDCSGVIDQLQHGVRRVYSNAAAFAAVLLDGGIVTWGGPDCGGDSSEVQHLLEGDVVDIYSTMRAFAAVFASGRVVTWGHPQDGGDSSLVEQELLDGDVQEICSTNFGAFAALMADGSVVAWGDGAYGGSTQTVQRELHDVRQIYSNWGAFAAVRGDGRVVTWGGGAYGVDTLAVQERLHGGVQHIYSSARAFAAVKSDGQVVTWGDSDYGGDSRAVQEQLGGALQYVHYASDDDDDNDDDEDDEPFAIEQCDVHVEVEKEKTAADNDDDDDGKDLSTTPWRSTRPL